MAATPRICNTSSLKVAGILLAAGMSKRFGEDNKLLRHWRGRPLLLHAASIMAAAQAAGYLHASIAVVGRDANLTTPLLTPLCVVAYNPNYAKGVASSLRCGLRRINNADAALIFLADMPLVTVDDVAAIIGAFYKTNAPIIAPSHNGKRGNPVLVARSEFCYLRDIKGDNGARMLFSQTPPLLVKVAGAGVLMDIDLPSQWQ